MKYVLSSDAFFAFKGFFILVLLRVGQVQKTDLSSHLKTLKLSVGGNAMFTPLASLVMLVPVHN